MVQLYARWKDRLPLSVADALNAASGKVTDDDFTSTIDDDDDDMFIIGGGQHEEGRDTSFIIWVKVNDSMQYEGWLFIIVISPVCFCIHAKDNVV